MRATPLWPRALVASPSLQGVVYPVEAHLSASPVPGLLLPCNVGHHRANDKGHTHAQEPDDDKRGGHRRCWHRHQGRIRSGLLQIGLTVAESGDNRGDTITQARHLVPFIGCTIRTQRTYACVAVARAARHHTRHIQPNATDRTLCFHAFLGGSGDDSVLSSWTALTRAKDEANFSP